MNNFGRLARDHWAEWLPGRYAQVGDPEAFFEVLGLEVAEQIEATVTATTAPVGLPAGRVAGWWETARANATSQALSELVFLTPEEDLDAETPPDPMNPGAIHHQVMMEIYEDEREQDYQDQVRFAAELAEHGISDPPI